MTEQEYYTVKELINEFLLHEDLHMKPYFKIGVKE